MTNEDLCFTPAAELAALIRARKLSPVELTDIVLDRLHALEPKLNAFITITDDQARIDARRAEQAVMDGETLGPLHGVPMGLKDFIETKGVRTTFGSHLMVDNVPKQDSVVAARVRAAGGIFLGKTMGPDMGWKATGDSILTGSSHNPWSLDHTPGGSSSGACATVAAGIGTLTVGTDGAGSIRIPASFCGVFGLKPSYGRVPQPGQSPTNGSHTGPIGRTVADGALLLKVIAGPHESDPATLQAAPKDYPALLETGVAGKRMAWSLDLGFAEMMDPEVADLCAKAARAFEDTGAIVEEATPRLGQPHAHHPGLLADCVGGSDRPRHRGIPGPPRSRSRRLRRGGTAPAPGDLLQGPDGAGGLLRAHPSFLRALRFPTHADGGGSGAQDRADRPRRLPRSSLGLALLVSLRFSLQSDMAPGGDGSRRVYPGRPASRPADRRPALRRPGRPPGLRRLRAGTALGTGSAALGHG